MRATSVRRCGSSVKPLRDHADQPPPPELEEMTARGRNRDPCEAREFGWRMRGELAFGAWGGPGASLNHPRGAGTAWSPTRTRSLAVRAAGPIGRAPRRHANPPHAPGGDAHRFVARERRIPPWRRPQGHVITTKGKHRMAAFTRALVLPEATPIGALSALLRHSAQRPLMTSLDPGRASRLRTGNPAR